MHFDSLPAVVRREWFGDAPLLSSERVMGGFSGAAVYRCQRPDGTVALRQWPVGIRREWVDEIHRLLRATYGHGCRLIPKVVPTRGGGEIFEWRGRRWDGSTWLDGQPWNPDTTPLAASDAVRLGCSALGQVHRSIAHLASRQAPPPSVEARWNRLVEITPWLETPLQFQPTLRGAAGASRLSSLPAWLPEVERQLKKIWQFQAGPIRDRLRWYLRQRFALQYVLRDVHRDHVLFAGGRVSGLIDFDAIRVDSPAADLARFVSSFLDVTPAGPARQTLWEAALAGYRDERTFSEQEFLLAKFLAEIGPFLSLVNWAIWSIQRPHAFAASPAAVAARTHHLSNCLQTTFDIG